MSRVLTHYDDDGVNSDILGMIAAELQAERDAYFEHLVAYVQSRFPRVASRLHLQAEAVQVKEIKISSELYESMARRSVRRKFVYLETQKVISISANLRGSSGSFNYKLYIVPGIIKATVWSGNLRKGYLLTNTTHPHTFWKQTLVDDYAHIEGYLANITLLILNSTG